MARKSGIDISALFQDEQDLIKTAADASGENATTAKYQKVAKFLILLGADQAAQILSHLSSKQAEAVSREIASIKGITREEAEGLFDEFHSLMAASSGGYNGSFTGGVDEARRLLYAAYGPEKGESVLKKAVPKATENPFDFLEEFTAEQLHILFKEENAAAEALVLSRLPPRLAADVINQEDAGKKTEIIKHIAKMRKIAPSVLEQVAAALKEKVRKIGKTDSEKVDGMNTLAAILKSSDVSFESRLLNELESRDPTLSYDLRAPMGEREIVFLLKGRNQAFKDKILSNVSAPRRALLREEEEILGPVSRIEADEVASDFLNWFRRGREKGDILLLDDDDILM